MQLEECINFLLAKSQQKVHQLFKSGLKEFGVTPVQYGVLNVLWQKDGLYSTEISHALMLDNSTITGIIDRLISHELIERKDDPNDRRKSLLFLTEKGKQLEEPVQQCVKDMNRKVLEKFNEEEREVLKKLLATMIKNN